MSGWLMGKVATDPVFIFNIKLLSRFIGAAEGTRTPDPIITNDVLYQLSYCGARSP